MRCNLCNSNNFSKILHIKELVMCDNCNLVFFLKQPKYKDIRKLYNNEFFSPSKYYKKLEKSDMKNFSIIFKEIKKYKKPGKMLDVGCSTGNMIDFARSNGWSVCGIEPNMKSVRECRKKGLKVSEKPFGEGVYPDNYFDWIHMGDVIEHVKNPIGMLRIANIKLKKDGILTLSTPDISKWLTRKFQIKPDEHIFYFDKKTISKALVKCGFRIVIIRNYAPYRNISAMAHSSTFKKKSSKFVFNIMSRLGDLIIRIPIKDELLVIAIKD